MFKNRRGILFVEAAFAVLFAVGFAVSLHPGTIAWNVHRRAMEKCEAEVKAGNGGNLSSCPESVGAMSLKDQKEFIRDKADGPTIYNFTHR